VGLVTAACLSHLGHRVAAIETDPSRLAPLQQGEVPFSEPGLGELVERELASGRLSVSGDPATALAGKDAVLVCVGTPLAEDGTADLSQVRSACASIRQHAPTAVVVVRSTLPPGVAGSLARWLGRPDRRSVVLNPEFLRQATAVADFLSPSRVVIGTHDGRPNAASRLVEHLYQGTSAPVLVTDHTSAELIKNAANAYLATRLAFINEVADLCEAYGADIDAVRDGLGLDPRIGSGYLRPGIGFGGSCLPKELANVARLGREAGIGLPMLEGAQSDNIRRPHRAVDRVERLIGGLAGRQVAVLGLAFKPHTDDVRDSPSLALVRELVSRGARVRAHDPTVRRTATDGIEGVSRADSEAAALRGADLVIVATDWPCYRVLDWHAMSRVVRRPVVFDTRGALDPAGMTAAGWTLVRVGARDPEMHPAMRSPGTAPAPLAHRATHDDGRVAPLRSWSAGFDT
jgi:UDPglucose 6-dehydrogenase